MALCIFMNLLYELEEKEISFEHLAQASNQYYTEQINPFLTFPAKTLNLLESDFGAFLAAVDDEDETVSRTMAMNEYLRSKNALKGLDITSLETLFSELFMNICQHSWAKNGIAFVSFPSNSSIIEIIISDIGVGIPSNIREEFSEYQERTDAEAIRYATQDWITTRSTDRNQGRGLNHTKTILSTLNGKGHIYSGYGALTFDKNTELALETDFHHGTQIHLLIDFSNFEKAIEPDYTEEVDF